MAHPRRDETRRRLLDAAVRVFARCGIGAASIAEVCEEAGYTRGAFYSNFATRTDLCVALLEHEHDVAMAAAQRAVDMVREVPGHDVCHLARRILAARLEMSPLSAELVIATQEIRLLAAREPELAAVMARHQHEVEEHVHRRILDAVHDANYSFRLPIGTVFAVVEALMAHLATAPGETAAEDDVLDQATSLVTLLIRPDSTDDGR